MERGLSGYALPLAVVPGFGKYLFMGDGPGNTGYWDGQDEKPVDWLGDTHGRCTAISLPQASFP
jgi:hypothetical protein